MMPCSDGNYSHAPEIRYVRDKEAEQRCHALARLLCEACMLIPYEVMLADASSQLRAWRKAHEAEDAARKQAEEAQKNMEKLRKAGVAKLTKDERKALGV